MLICARVLSGAQLTEDDFSWLRTFATEPPLQLPMQDGSKRSIGCVLNSI
jgi:hypothetical protein